MCRFLINVVVQVLTQSWEEQAQRRDFFFLLSCRLIQFPRSLMPQRTTKNLKLRDNPYAFTRALIFASSIFANLLSVLFLHKSDFLRTRVVRLPLLRAECSRRELLPSWIRTRGCKERPALFLLMAFLPCGPLWRSLLLLPSVPRWGATRSTAHSPRGSLQDLWTLMMGK